jgi:hypothetical protein
LLLLSLSFSLALRDIGGSEGGSSVNGRVRRNDRIANMEAHLPKMLNYRVSHLSTSQYRLIFLSIFQSARVMGSGRRNSQQFTDWLKACLSVFDSTGGGQGLSVKEN